MLVYMTLPKLFQISYFKLPASSIILRMQKEPPEVLCRNRCSSQNSRENICVGVSILIKLYASVLQLY